jgi:hypothetical protein
MGNEAADRPALPAPTAREAPGITRRTLLAVTAAGVVAACSGRPDQHRQHTASSLRGRRLYYGAAVPTENLHALEQAVGERLSCHRTYFVAGQEGALIAQARTDIGLGRLPLVSIKPPGSWARTATDLAWLDSLVEPLSEISGPVYLIIHHEPENDTRSHGTAADFVAMQRAALSRAAQAGTNVTVVPVLSSWSFDTTAARQPAEWNVADAPVYGVDLYNPWSPTNGATWTSFADRLALSLPTAGGRPILIGEYGCRTDPSTPGRAASWLVSAFYDALRADVVAMAYFDSYRDSGDATWELDAETLPVFARLMRQRHVEHVHIA